MALPGGALLGVPPTLTPSSLILLWTTRASKEGLLGGPPSPGHNPRLLAGLFIRSEEGVMNYLAGKAHGALQCSAHTGSKDVQPVGIRRCPGTRGPQGPS